MKLVPTLLLGCAFSVLATSPALAWWGGDNWGGPWNGGDNYSSGPWGGGGNMPWNWGNNMPWGSGNNMP